jgi:hypothetical protein
MTSLGRSYPRPAIASIRRKVRRDLERFFPQEQFFFC